MFAWFSTTDGGSIPLVRDYVASWMRANRTWVRIWRSDTITEETLEFSSDFSSDARVESLAEGSRFAVVLEGKPSSLRWKDWVIFLVADLCKVFPEVKLERVDS